MSEEKRAASRRDFLKLAAAGAPAAAVATVATPGAAEVLEETATSGLRQTEHTKKYYDSARF